MTSLYLLLSALSGTAFYLSTAHQHLWTAARSRPKVWRLIGGVASLLSATAAIIDLGALPGLFAAATATMLTMVLLPYLDAWRRIHREHPHAR